MIERLLAFVLRRRLAVLAFFALVAIVGAATISSVPIDAVPDITNKQVQINTVAPALAPVEIEKRVSQTIETALAGTPGIQSTRSISRNGFSQVTAVFSEGTDIYFARQQVAERLAQVRGQLPEGAEPQMGALTTGLGEVLLWSVDFDSVKPVGAGQPGFQSDGTYLTPEGERLTDLVAKLSYLRTVQDWIIAREMRTVNGVAGVDSIGGYEKQYVVTPDAGRLAAYGLSYDDVVQALQAANVSVGADYIHRSGEILLVKADARLHGVEEIAAATVATRAGVPVLVRDVADVRIGGGIRLGAATENGHEAVIGTVQMLTGANSRTVAASAAAKLDEIARTLPPGVVVRVIYNRSKLVDATISTVAHNMGEGALLVIAILFLLLGNLRAALITALVIPMAMLMTTLGMRPLGISGNLMSFGALDFGLIVDGAVIVVENCLRRLAERQAETGRVLSASERLEEVRVATAEMIGPTLYGQGVILLVYVPLLTFQGVEGKMFAPMAITVMLALASALVLSLTVVPALVAIAIRGRVREHDARPIAWARARYGPLLEKALANGRTVIGGAVAMVALAGLLFLTLGKEFIPQLDEQDFALEVTRTSSVSLETALELQRQIDRRLRTMPEVELIFSKLGTAEAATDPMPPGSGDMFVILKPRSEWPDPSLSKEKVLQRASELIDPLIGSQVEFTQPIQMRFNELIAGVKGDVAVKIYGEDLAALSQAGAEVARVLSSTPGSTGARVQQVGGFPAYDITFDRTAIARAGLNVRTVADAVAVATGGRQAGIVMQGDRQFDVTVRAPDSLRFDPADLGDLPIPLPNVGAGQTNTVPLRSLARFKITEGLNQVNRENGQRLVIVQTNVSGRALGSFVADAQKRVERQVRLPVGSRIEWGGQFENLRSAQQRLLMVVPLAFVLIFALLYGALGSARMALLVFSAVPLALAGGIFSLVLRQMPFSISAAVGLIALSGVAVLNGLVMMTSIRRSLEDGLPLIESVKAGAEERLRPVLMTALVASLGFIPMAIATSTGAEVQRPLATVVIGGLITATALTLFVLPVLVAHSGAKWRGQPSSVASEPLHDGEVAR